MDFQTSGSRRDLPPEFRPNFLISISMWISNRLINWTCPMPSSSYSPTQAPSHQPRLNDGNSTLRAAQSKPSGHCPCISLPPPPYTRNHDGFTWKHCFSTWALLASGGGIILCCGVCPVHFRMFSNIPGFYFAFGSTPQLWQPVVMILNVPCWAKFSLIENQTLYTAKTQPLLTTFTDMTLVQAIIINWPYFYSSFLTSLLVSSSSTDHPR